MPETIYFVTCCTEKRRDGLLAPPLANRVLDTVKASDGAADTQTFAFTSMPDHCHWLFRLGGRLSLGRIMAKFKGQTNEALAATHHAWQRDFYEHRLLSDEDLEDYALYIFLNPYRAGLVPFTASWPWWWTAAPTALRFLPMLDPGGTPPAEWIAQPVPPGVRHGE